MPKPTFPWLPAALDYLDQWMPYQIERYRQPGCSMAVVRSGKLLAQRSFGVADLRSKKALTPKHYFRIASHSKSFTATGVMLLRERGKLSLDDAVGRYVKGLDKSLAKARIGQLLSHGAGVVRDGADNGQFTDQRPFLSRKELLAELAQPQPLAAGKQLKYSNHGYGLLGLLMEEITGQDYSAWMRKHVIDAAGLLHVSPSLPLPQKGSQLATGHSVEFPFGQRLIIPCDQDCHAITPAGGYAATAADTARFFDQLAPTAKKSILSEESRREMQQRRWRDPVNLLESHYGLGLMMSGPGAQEWFGHTGSLQGFISRTSHFLHSGYTISILTNASDGAAYPWVDGVLSILQTFERHGAPNPKWAHWAGRWWNSWGATDLVPMGDAVRCASPMLFKPFDDTNGEIHPSSKDKGQFGKVSGYLSPGESARLLRNRTGDVSSVQLAGSRLLTREAMMAQALATYSNLSSG
jgi:D-alanyl-D-alanine carboxypeptidase